MYDHFRRDIGSGSRPVVDDERLTEPLGEPLSNYSGDNVGRASRGKPDDDVHRPRRISRAPMRPAASRQRGGDRCQMQKFAAGKFQFVTCMPSRISARSA